MRAYCVHGHVKRVESARVFSISLLLGCSYVHTFGSVVCASVFGCGLPV